MRATNASIISVLLFAVLATVAENDTSAEECCECGCEYKLKKVYTPVVTFKEVTFTGYDYSTQCEEVTAPASTCSNPSCECDCGRCDEKCGCPGKPTKILVPVAHTCRCYECVRKVPCVT